MNTRLIILLLLSAVCSAQPAQQTLKTIPPKGIELTVADRSELEKGVAELGQEINSLRNELKNKPSLLELLPDIQIFYNAVHYALKYDEFLNAKEIPLAKEQLRLGLLRAQELRAGNASWVNQTGLVVRGYLSKIDGSVQPYGLIVPATYQSRLPFNYRLDIWFHGRNENLTEINFINDRLKNFGQFTPPNTFVLHPYGRYCNANKFAGEIDTFEALEHARSHYPIDENRISVRGFSMGGGATWHFATHHAGLWASAAPGAGFAESQEYLKLNIDEFPWYQQKLWHWYNATDYAANLFNLPIVAYSGELDRQIQAAQVMAREMKKVRLELTHIIGPKTEHKYHPDSIPEINRRIDSIVARGRNPVPLQVKFTTYTLRYNKMFWVTVDQLEEHWKQANVTATIKENTVTVKTENITAITLAIPSGLSPFTGTPVVMLDGQKLTASAVQSDRSWSAQFKKSGKLWAVIPTTNSQGNSNNNSPMYVAANSIPASTTNPIITKSGTPTQPGFVLAGAAHSLQKTHGLQGPVDDAFLERFIFVRPTGKAFNEAIGNWVNTELDYARKIWRSQFRGEPIVKADTEITDADIAHSNLILWGDPSSNKIMARIAAQLPIKWGAAELQVGAQQYTAAQHIPILIYPNPLNPNRYVVLNSGYTFREASSSNAWQTPKLPDWAIIDISIPASPISVGKVVNAGFFGERWELK